MSNVQSNVISRTKDWVESIVIGLDLCPFASYPFQEGSIKYVLASPSYSLVMRLDLVVEEFNAFTEGNDNIDIETTLIIFPKGLSKFREYLDFLDLCQRELKKLELEGVIQLASFHPEYQFADLDIADVRNYTNRSPYPMIHILKESSVSQAIDSHPDVHSIPLVNQEKLLALGLEYFKKNDD